MHSTDTSHASGPSAVQTQNTQHIRSNTTPNYHCQPMTAVCQCPSFQRCCGVGSPKGKKKGALSHLRHPIWTTVCCSIHPQSQNGVTDAVRTDRSFPGVSIVSSGYGGSTHFCPPKFLTVSSQPSPAQPAGPTEVSRGGLSVFPSQYPPQSLQCECLSHPAGLPFGTGFFFASPEYLPKASLC